MDDRKRSSSVGIGLAATFAGRKVNRIGYGAMQLRTLADHPDDAASLLRLAINLGVDHIDTARFYGGGFVNNLIRQVVQPSDEVLVATKIGADPDPHAKPLPIRLAQRPEQLRASVDAELESLGVERLDVVYLRRAKNGHGLVVGSDQIVEFDDQMDAMVSMHDEGKIGAIGLSGVDLAELERAVPAGIACVQNAYSLVARQDEAMLSLCREKNIAWVPFYPLGGGRPEMPKVTEQPAVRRGASQVGATPTQVGLAWLLAHAPNIFLIPGTASVDHLRENMAAASVVLSQDIIADLDDVTPGTPS